MVPSLPKVGLPDIPFIPGTGGDGSDKSGKHARGSVGDFLTDLPEVDINANVSDVPLTITDEAAAVSELYMDIARDITDPVQQAAVLRRIAELQITDANDALMDGEVDPFAPAITALQEALTTSTEDNRGELIYQLARIYDLSGKQEEQIDLLSQLIENGSGDPAALVEARFRRAEYFFSHNDYISAAEDYAFVANTDSAYQLHAQYMLGWSQFRMDERQAALSAFLNTIEQIPDRQRDEPGPYRDLLEDTLRVTAISLDALGGAEVLAAEMDGRQQPDWQPMVYLYLSDWYRDNERFSDSAETLTRFLEENPMHPDAPRLALSIIDTWRDAGFVEDIPALKTAFIENYDKRSGFFGTHGDDVFVTYRDDLKEFLELEVARYHARAQEAGQPDLYLTASDWYQRWLDNFDGDDETPRNMFLKAETLQLGGAVEPAIAAYQDLIDRDPSFERTRDAAYAIVLLLTDLHEAYLAVQVPSAPTDGETVEDADPFSSDPYLERRLVAADQFTSMFPEDERSPNVAVAASKLVFDAGDYIRALALAEGNLAAFALTPALQQTTDIIVAHSQFELEDYASAAEGYRQLMVVVTDNPDEYARFEERLSISLFKLAEQFEAAEDFRSVIATYEEIIALQPSSDLTRDLRYDMAELYEKIDRPDLAIAQLQSFRKQYPGHPLIPDIGLRLIALYEAGNFLTEAAAELLTIARDDSKEAEVRRQSLYRAAELYLQAENTELAIATFRDYAHGYETPVPDRFEAMHQMDLLYQQTGEPLKRGFWLRKKMKTYDEYDGEKSPRMTWLAAQASHLLAEDQLVQFEKIKLTLPLQDSLGRKQTAMTASIKAYEKVARYGVAEFVTASTFRIAGIYRNLASGIMDSEMPNGLSELELEQYTLLLEEQAFPFEEQAIDIHKINLERGWGGDWDEWIDQSLAQLASLSPGRYRREERGVQYVRTL